MKPQPIFGPDDLIGEGDSRLVLNLLPDELREGIFERLREEVAWETMYHRGGEVPRLVAVQGRIEENGSFPVYRHPSDQSPALRPFTPTVDLVRRHAEAIIGHPLNHALIQLYRDGKDYISEHSDKTIDITRGTSIANVSFGAKRLMILRRKKDSTQKSKETDKQAQTDQNAKMDQQAPISTTVVESSTRPSPGPPRESQRIALPDNSMLVMGLRTNAAWLHAIHRDNRPDKAKLPEETGERISLTFRCIGTFLIADSIVCTADGMRIFGQGATGKTREQARPVIFAGEEAEELLAAFGKENHETNFDWEASYRKGFDVLHFAAKRG
ncbi:hypothetical protein K523DRAFT_254772 [Schizophyllum commune Tattone D]|nr:hypothetical protein K525DRAFT_272472 [Schizophyllum commune Loenen D]KAI5823654.1 hypothetical protein K523DRAFT_254772 [Schizophyllum commune Tattone D]